jgi:hypothetical protein
MARQGRPRKSGQRTKSGRLVTKQKYDKGAYRTELKQSTYGTDGSDALGRAYCMGLLGEHGDTLLATGRAIARTYWPIFGTGRISCTLGQQTGSGGEGSLSQEQWLTEQLDVVNALGREYRNAFDSLVIEIHPDEGPTWLDRAIAKQQTKADSETLLRAIFALQRLAA